MPWGTLAAWVLDHRRLVWGVLLVSVVVALWIGFPPKIEPNLLALLPPDQPAAIALRELHANEGGANVVTLAFAGEPEHLEPFLDGLARELERSERVRFAVHGIDEELATRLGLLQLDPADVSTLSGRMRGALALGPALNPIVTQQLMAMGPVTERIEAITTTPGALPGSEAGGGRLLVRPTGSSHDPMFSLALMEELEATVAAALAASPEISLEWIGGAYRHNVEDYKGIQQDLWWTGGASLLLVLIVISFTFRSARAILLVSAPLLMSLAITLGLARILIGSLNTYTSFGSAILAGLGIDFAVHLVGRYRELRADGTPLHEAIITAWDRVGPPCATAALTSSAGFLALAVADFRGFAQLGILLATGIMVALGTMVVVLPLLIPILDAEPPLLRGTGQAQPQSTSTYAMAPGLLMVLVLITGLLGATRLPRLDWEYDVSALRRDGLAYAELDEGEQALARESYSPVVVTFPSAEARSAASARIEALQADGRLPHIERVVSIESVLPPDQQLRLDALAELQGLLEDPNNRYLPPPLIQRLQPLRGLPLEPLGPADLPAPIRTLLGAGEPDTHRLLLLPRGNMWDLRQAAALETEVTQAIGDHPAAGEYVALGALYRVMVRDIPIVGLLALILVTLLTAIDLRRPHWIAGAIGTLLAGLIWAGSALQLFGVRLTMVNIVGIPILLGIGVDVVIHLLHRLAEEGPGGVRRALGTTGIAAAISALTTILSFCSLILAGNRGVRSLGMLVVIGLIAVFIASAVVLPTAWAAGWRVTGRAPSDQR